MTTAPVSFDVKLTQQDVERASMYIFRRVVLVGPRAIIYGVVIVVMFSSIVSSLFRSDDGELSFTSLFLALWIPAAFVFVWWRTRAAIRKAWKDNFRLHEVMHYVLTEEKLVQTGDTFNLDTPWDKIIRVELWKDLYLFYVAKNRANVVPRSALAADQEQQMCQLLDQVKPGWRKK